MTRLGGRRFMMVGGEKLSENTPGEKFEGNGENLVRFMGWGPHHSLARQKEWKERRRGRRGGGE